VRIQAPPPRHTTDCVPVITHFNRQWKGPEPLKIGKVFEIRPPRSILKPREAYKCGLDSSNSGTLPN